LNTTARELFVVSDLHIGGRFGDQGTPGDRGHRINTHVDALCQFVEGLAMRRGGSRAVELVLNGDIVDFLAEEGPPERRWRPFIHDPVEAVAAFDEVVRRDSEFFSALSKFLARGHQLTLLLGNHDVELSLPAVRKRFERAIGATRASRLLFLYDNEAYAVGDVLIEHGNRYDGWNMIDHDAVRRLRSAQSRRLTLPRKLAVSPPPGSLMVSEVLNDIKSTYPFVDLLKPETSAVVPILLALDPTLRDRLLRVARFAVKAAIRGPVAPAQPRFAGDIASGSSGPGALATREDPAAEESLTPASAGDVSRLEDILGAMAGPARKAFSDAIEAELRDDGFTADISSSGTERPWLCLSRLALWPQDRLERRIRTLLTALRTLQHARTFSLDGPEEDPYLEACERLVAEGGFRTIIFGHTHLARDLALPAGGRYLNCGTWADLMEFPTDVLSGSADEALPKVEAFVHTLAENRLAGHIRFRPSYVHVQVDDDGTTVSADVCFYQG